VTSPVLATRRRDPAAKQAQLLAAARALFCERGYAATSSAQVAARAGVSEGLLFHHFGSKRGLLGAVAADYGRGLAGAMFAGDPLALPVDGAEGMLRRAFAYVREHGAGLALTLLGEERDAAAEATRAEIVAALSQAFEAWRAAELMRPMDGALVAELLFGLVDAGIRLCFLRGQGHREDDVIRELALCIQGAVAPLPAVAEQAEAAYPECAAQDRRRSR
jgi:AcrR family transcriptional regulator